MSIRPGSRLGPYVIEDLIAQGGMGSVWRARDMRANQLMAIKAIANDLITDPEFRVRIQDEARRHQSLNHPHIVPVPDVFVAEGATCIVMKLIEGASLATMLDKAKRLSVDESVRIIKDVLLALNYAHRHGIVHRDVKPSNILVDQTGWVWLFDFGVAIAMGEARRTRTGVTVGTLAYMSPEQITHPRRIDHRSDVYAVGCLLYELLTGRPPFVRNEDGVGDTDFALQQAHVKLLPVNPRRRVPSIPPEVDAIVMRALEKNPDERLPGCQEFARLLAEQPAPDDTAEATTTPTPPGTRLKLAAIVAAVLLLLFLFLYLQS
jgi:serine/threonine protein kinase